MTQIVLSTGNIVSGGPSIIRKRGDYRSNLEFTSSLRNHFLVTQQDYAAATPPNGNGSANGSANGTPELNGSANGGLNGGAHTPYTNGHGTAPEIWTEKNGATLYVPRIDWSSAGLQEERDQYEITLKLFFLPTAPVDQRSEYIQSALGLVQKELGVQDVDLIIASFPAVSFEGDCEWEADKLNATMGNDEEERTTWAALEKLHTQGQVRKLGIAEFGSRKLADFISQVKVRPEVDQINIKNCCNVPPPLSQLAKEQGIELLTHSDCTDILPSGTLRELLGPAPQGAGLLADESGAGGLKGNLIPQWVVKYTAFVKDRGVIENKGYFAGAELVEE